MSLYPTKTRLALLRDIATDQVTLCQGEFGHDNGRKVTAAAQEQIKAGWAYLMPPSWNSPFQSVAATELGYRLLAEHFPDQWSEVSA